MLPPQTLRPGPLPSDLQAGQDPSSAPWRCSALAAREVWTATGRLPLAAGHHLPQLLWTPDTTAACPGQGPVPRTCEAGSCQDFRCRGPLG